MGAVTILDLHSIIVTPGAVLTLGSNIATIPSGDGAPNPGVPLNAAANQAILRMWGYHSVTADTIASLKMWSQDMVDVANGYTIVPGAASLLVQFYDYASVPYIKGARFIQAGTNTGVVAGSGWLLDSYKNSGTMRCVRGSASMGGDVVTGLTTFGGALTTNVWGTQAYAPSSVPPSGKYAILGAWVSAITNVALIRFSHSDFGGLKPGFPVLNYELGAVATMQVAQRDELMLSAQGEQFVKLGQILGEDCCPVFTIGVGSTGLTIEMNSCQADTPLVTLVLAKVG